jgi:hypothetical protein
MLEEQKWKELEKRPSELLHNENDFYLPGAGIAKQLFQKWFVDNFFSQCSFAESSLAESPDSANLPSRQFMVVKPSFLDMHGTNTRHSFPSVTPVNVS